MNSDIEKIMSVFRKAYKIGVSTLSQVFFISWQMVGRKLLRVNHNAYLTIQDKEVYAIMLFNWWTIEWFKTSFLVNSFRENGKRTTCGAAGVMCQV